MSFPVKRPQKCPRNLPIRVNDAVIMTSRIPFAEWFWLCQKVSCFFIFFNDSTINIKSWIWEPLRIKHFTKPKILSSFLRSSLREHVVLWDHCSVRENSIQTWVNGRRGFGTDCNSRAAYKHQSWENGGKGTYKLRYQRYPKCYFSSALLKILLKSLST